MAKRNFPSDDGDSQQIIGREGETATFIWRCLFNSELREFGFAPRQLNRYASFFGLTLKIAI
ncbi:MAG: hypothetical protein H0X72_01720 [Acidobacteria bacterium]|jgi:hypothetical protein|nr:hypothetical protein [Acidobacteriota bacterium]